MTLTEQHNIAAGVIVSEIVKGPLEAGGQLSDVLVLLESVNVGVCLAIVKLGGDDPIIDEMAARVKERLAAIRLAIRPVQGQA